MQNYSGTVVIFSTIRANPEISFKSEKSEVLHLPEIGHFVLCVSIYIYLFIYICIYIYILCIALERNIIQP